jgi:sec-independent protein translocase protein TatA
MGFGSVWHWVIVLLVVLVLFGKGRVSDIMGDFGKGIKSFKEGLNEGETKPVTPPTQIEGKGETIQPAATPEHSTEQK